MANHALTYSGGWLDRAGSQRADPRWVEAILHHADARVIPLWRDKCLVKNAPPIPVILPATDAGAVRATAGDYVFLGLDGNAGVFAADLSSLDEPRAVELVAASGVLDVRHLVGTLSAPVAATLAYARGILHWNRSQRYCGVCGGDTRSRNGGHLRVCLHSNCGKLLFPRIEPAVIVLVEAPGTPPRCLLGRHKGAAEDSYSTLAGFVEVGESLEDAVRREVAEEAGIPVGTVSYQASQAWPFPAGLMVGFRARATSDVVAVDRDELEEARWFTRAELGEWVIDPRKRNLFNDDSIEKFLITSWMSEGS